MYVHIKNRFTNKSNKSKKKPLINRGLSVMDVFIRVQCLNHHRHLITYIIGSDNLLV